MGDGFIADPTMMREYAGKVGALANQMAEASGAAGTVLNENAVKMPTVNNAKWARTDLTGQFDGAYGIICQPGGMLMQDIQNQLVKAISGTLGLMQEMQRKLAECATNYQQVDEQNANRLKKVVE